MIDLDELQRLHEAATPGPLYVERVDCDDGNILYELHSDYAIITSIDARTGFEEPRSGCRKALADIFVASRNALPALLRLARRARRLEEVGRAYLRAADAVCESADIAVALDYNDALDALRAALAEGEE